MSQTGDIDTRTQLGPEGPPRADSGSSFLPLPWPAGATRGVSGFRWQSVAVTAVTARVGQRNTLVLGWERTRSLDVGG